MRAALDEMRADGARWPEMQPIRDALRDDDDALIAEFDSRFWIWISEGLITYDITFFRN